MRSYCTNRACPAQIFRLLVHFAGRGAMDIDGLGESMSMTLLQKGLVDDLADVYSIRKEQLMELDRIGDKMAQNLVDAIARSKSRPLPNLIYALGIRHVGYETAELLVSHFGNMDALVAASLEDLTAVPTIGPRTAQSFYEYLHDEQNAALIAKLREAGVNMVGERVAAREGPLTGLALVVSGSLTRWSATRSKA